MTAGRQLCFFSRMRTTGGMLAATVLALLSTQADAGANVELNLPGALVNGQAADAIARWAYANPDSGCGGTFSAASADLTAGTFRGYTDLQTPADVTGSPATGFPTVEATAGFSDFVTFVGGPGVI